MRARRSFNRSHVRARDLGNSVSLQRRENEAPEVATIPPSSALLEVDLDVLLVEAVGEF